MRTSDEVVLSVRDLKVHFVNGRGKYKMTVKAIDGINFDIYKGEVFGLVGESGCGKTTTGRTCIKLHDPTDGEIFFLGKRIAAGTQTNVKTIKNIKKTTSAKVKKLKAEMAKELENVDKSSADYSTISEKYNTQIDELLFKKYEVIAAEKAEMSERKKDTMKTDTELMKNMQMIFQDPIESLNPRMTVKEIIAEGLKIAGERDKELINDKVNAILRTVGLLPEHASRYPHEFSGGQRQRIGIARAIIVSPGFIIADEPISALDVSIQAQVINLLNDLRDELGLTIMFIAHDLSVIKYFSDRVAVMYYGNMVELADAAELFKNPLHPYTKSLLSAVPLPDPHYEKNRIRIKYDPRMHNYTDSPAKLHEINPGHFILANKEELEQYKKELK